MESSHSGLVHYLGKVAYLNGYRGFESLTLRDTELARGAYTQTSIYVSGNLKLCNGMMGLRKERQRIF